MKSGRFTHHLQAVIIVILCAEPANGADSLTPIPEQKSEVPAIQPLIERPIPLETLSTRSIGLVKRSAIYEWRKAAMIIDLQVGQPVEYNNFNSRSWHLELCFPQTSSYLRIGFHRTIVNDSKTSRELRETPYYQAGRASRWELSPAIAIPIQEGIGNQLFELVPPSQFVLAAVAELNFTFYQANDPLLIKKVIKTRLSGEEKREGTEHAPQSMKLSGARHDVGIGLQWDNYFSTGVKWDYRALFHIAPLAKKDELRYWWSFVFGVGYGF
jgi:hypothetical protein